MRRWYPFLKPNETEDKGLALLSHEMAAPGNMIVARTLEQVIEGKVVKKHMFARFNSYIEFVRHSHLEVADSHRCFFERITNGLSQKPYFDLDIKLGDQTKHNYTREDGVLGITHLIAAIHQLLPMINKKDVMIFSSHGETKMSYHVVVDRWCFSDGENCKAFAFDAIKLLPERLQKMVDHTMQKNGQEFRTYLSHKYGSDRFKRIDPMSTWIPVEPPDTEMEGTFQISLASIITNTSYCKILPRFAKEKPVWNGEGVDVSADQLDRALQLTAVYVGVPIFRHPTCPFSFVKVDEKGLIILKRHRPSRCKKCERTHDSNNPYITIDKRGGAWFHCRGEREDSTFIGDTSAGLDVAVTNSPAEVKIIPSPVQPKSPAFLHTPAPLPLSGLALLNSLKPMAPSLRPLRGGYPR